VEELDLELAIQDAVTKAVASKHPEARKAYMDLAKYFEGQLAQARGSDAAQHALATR
jgi:hypothetical protein